MLTDRDAVVMQEPDMRRHLIAIVAGFAAEKIEFGVVSTGVHDDLHAATGLARADGHLLRDVGRRSGR